MEEPVNGLMLDLSDSIPNPKVETYSCKTGQITLLIKSTSVTSLHLLYDQAYFQDNLAVQVLQFEVLPVLEIQSEQMKHQTIPRIKPIPFERPPTSPVHALSLIIILQSNRYGWSFFLVHSYHFYTCDIVIKRYVF